MWRENLKIGGRKMIPKVIHYCWFGGNPLPDMAVRCIESWKKYCPDYQIMEWNESNFDLDMYDYVKEAYEAKKWAFVSDVARLYALVNYGGIYMDTDVEVIKNLDPLLQYEAVSGFETETQIPTGLMACEGHHPLFEELLKEYEDAHFIRTDGTLDFTTNVTRITNACLKYGLIQNNCLQTVNGFTLLPSDYLCPKDYRTGEIRLTDRTMTIHHFDASWHTEEQKYAIVISKKLAVIMPQRVAGYGGKLISVIRYRGIKVAVEETILWIKRKK